MLIVFRPRPHPEPEEKIHVHAQYKAEDDFTDPTVVITRLEKRMRRIRGWLFFWS